MLGVILRYKKQPNISELFSRIWFYIVNNNLKNWIYQEWFYVVRNNLIFWNLFRIWFYVVHNNLKISGAGLILCCFKQPYILELFRIWFYVVNNNLKKWIYQEWFYVVRNNPIFFENFLGFWFYVANNNLKKWVYQEWFYVVRNNPIFFLKNFLGSDFKCFNNLKVLPGYFYVVPRQPAHVCRQNLVRMMSGNFSRK